MRRKTSLRNALRLDAADIAYAFSLSCGHLGERTRYRRCCGSRRRVCNQTRPSLIGANILTIYKNSELYQEILAGNWEEETEIEKYHGD